MTGALAPAERRTWGLAAGWALTAHVAAALLLLSLARPAPPPLPEPVVLVELPAPDAAIAAATPRPAEAQPQAPTPPSPAAPTPVAAPVVAAPLPAAPVVLTPAAAPVSAAPVSPQPPLAPSAAAASTSPLTSTDPRARKAEVDYFSLVSAWLNRRKAYPAEARKARQEGVVTIRFTVDRAGNVSAVAIKRSSGHDLLDTATMDLLRRVAPLPRMPDAMARQSVTLALPIEYSLKTS